MNTYYSAQRWTYQVLHSHDDHGNIARTIRVGTELLIIVNVLLVVLETVQSIEVVAGRVFYVIDLVSVGIFTLEYLLRIWSIPWKEAERENPWQSRWSYFRSAYGLIDLIAILPFYLHAFVVTDLRIVRALRLLRLERILLLSHYSKGFHTIAKAIRKTKDELTASFIIIFTILLIAASVLYFVEHDAQPEKFSSIPESLWWGVVTLTSVGYGDVYPITPLGKLLTGIIAVLGIGLVALPSGIIVSGFTHILDKEQKEKDREHEQQREAEHLARTVRALLAGACCPECGAHIDIKATNSDTSDHTKEM